MTVLNIVVCIRVNFHIMLMSLIIWYPPVIGCVSGILTVIVARQCETRCQRIWVIHQTTSLLLTDFSTVHFLVLTVRSRFLARTLCKIWCLFCILLHYWILRGRSLKDDIKNATYYARWKCNAPNTRGQFNRQMKLNNRSLVLLEEAETLEWMAVRRWHNGCTKLVKHSKVRHSCWSRWYRRLKIHDRNTTDQIAKPEKKRYD